VRARTSSDRLPRAASTLHLSFNIAIATSTQQQTSNPEADRQQQRHASHILLLSIPHLPNLTAHTGVSVTFRDTRPGTGGDFFLDGSSSSWGFFLFLSFCAADWFRLGLSISHWVRDEKQAGSNNERTASVAWRSLAYHIIAIFVALGSRHGRTWRNFRRLIFFTTRFGLQRTRDAFLERNNIRVR
jgi:hypothetical protein